MTISLYELESEFAALHNRLIETAGEWTDEVEAEFTRLGGIESVKVDSYQHVLAEFTAHASACQSEIERLQEKQQNALNAKRRLTERLKEYMEAKEVTELKGTTWKAVIQKNGGKPPLTVLMDPAQLPAPFVRYRAEPDTEAMRAAALPGGDVIGPEGILVARVEKPGTHLRFR